MIIGAVALLKMLLFGGSAGVEAILPADFNNRIEIYITDENTQNEIKNIIKIMNDNLGEYGDKLEEDLKSLHETNSNYLTTASDMEEEINELFKLREELVKYLMVSRSKIRDLVTEEQWNKLFDRTEETAK